MQFRDWGGMFMEHCHNTVHEDNAMLLRWEIDDGRRRAVPAAAADADPTPQGVTRNRATATATRPICCSAMRPPASGSATTPSITRASWPS
jgi:hypothetical protein